MGVYSGPEIVNNGLVFHYDMYNAQKSWKGKPTTNLISISGWNSNFNGTSPYWASMTRTSISTNTLFDGVNIGMGVTAVPDAHGFGYIDMSLPTGTTAGIVYACSFWYKSNSRTASVWCHDTTGANAVYSSTLPADGKWNRGTALFTSTSSGSVRLHFHLNAGSTNDVVYFTAPSIEQNTFVTPFVNGTRSNTQAIIDVTKNNTITASSLTYNSDGTFSFNGSSNYISANWAGVNTVAGNFNTVEVWLNWTGASNGFPMEFGSGYRLWMPSGNLGFNNGAGDCYGIDFSTYSNKWVHVTAIFYNGAYTGNNKIFVNGVQQTLTQKQGGATSGIVSTSGTIGNYGPSPGSYPFPGKISSFKIYNRALTATEIKQNFEAQRYQYGI